LLWIKYLDSEHLLSLVDTTANSLRTNPSPEVIEISQIVLSALQQSKMLSPQDCDVSRVPLRPLISLHPLLPDFAVLEDMITMAVERCLPMFHDGFPLPIADTTLNLTNLINYAESCWPRQDDPSIDGLNILSFLNRKIWSASSIRIMSTILYLQPTTRTVFLQWLGSNGCSTRPVRQLAIVLYAYLNSSVTQDEGLHESAGDILMPLIPRMVDDIVHNHASDQIRADSVACISLFVPLLHQQHQTEFDQILGVKIQSLGVEDLSLDLLRLGSRLSKTRISQSFVALLVDHALKWAARLYSGATKETSDAKRNIEELSKLY
jgi:nucleolar pre-ribosomal-associated protein 1